MDKLENKIPPPVLVLIIALGMYGASQILPQFVMSRAIGITASLAAMVTGLYFISAFNSFKRANTTINPLDPGEASSLVSSRP